MRKRAVQAACAVRREAIRIADESWAAETAEGIEAADVAAYPLPEKTEPEYLLEKRIFKVLLVLALLSIVISAAVNWTFGPLRLPSGSAKVRMPGRPGVPAPYVRPQLNDLPASIPGYESIGQQVVPGTEGRSVEAVYVTLNMDLEEQVSTAIYARVDGAAGMTSVSALKARMREFNHRQSAVVLPGGVHALSGYTANEGSYAIAWARGPNLYFLKSMFRDRIPADKQNTLRIQAVAVAQGIQTYLLGGKRKYKV